MKRLKCAYLIVLLIAYIYPLVPALMPAFSFIVDVKLPYFQIQNITFWSGGMGYQILEFPPLTCSPLHYGISYYTLIMPMNIIYFVSGILLIFIFRHILKVCQTTMTVCEILFLMSVVFAQVKFKINTEEKCLVVCFCYFMVTAYMNQIYHSISLRSMSTLIPAIFEYFSCEEYGLDSDYPCDTSYYTHNILYVLSIFSEVSTGLFSGIILMFVLNIKKEIRIDENQSYCWNLRLYLRTKFNVS